MINLKRVNFIVYIFLQNMYFVARIPIGCSYRRLHPVKSWCDHEIWLKLTRAKSSWGGS